MAEPGLTKEFVAERDARIFAMRKAGTSPAEIAKRFGMSTKAVNYAIQRQLTRLNQEALLAYPEVLRLELERLDSLQQSVWPLTQHRKIVAPDGEEIVLEPDLKAIQQALSIMDRRAKLLGMEAVNIQILSTETAAPRAVLADANDGPAAVDAFDPETEAKQLIELMSQAGVLPQEVANQLLGEAPLELEEPTKEIEDAVIVPDEVF